jgi:hypothetical protein
MIVDDDDERTRKDQNLPGENEEYYEKLRMAGRLSKIRTLDLPPEYEAGVLNTTSQRFFLCGKQFIVVEALGIFSNSLSINDAVVPSNWPRPPSQNFLHFITCIRMFETQTLKGHETLNEDFVDWR